MEELWERMEGFYLTLKNCPYFPIRLVEVGATGEAGALGEKARMTIQPMIIDPKAPIDTKLPDPDDWFRLMSFHVGVSQLQIKGFRDLEQF